MREITCLYLFLELLEERNGQQEKQKEGKRSPAVSICLCTYLVQLRLEHVLHVRSKQNKITGRERDLQGVPLSQKQIVT